MSYPQFALVVGEVVLGLLAGACAFAFSQPANSPPRHPGAAAACSSIEPVEAGADYHPATIAAYEAYAAGVDQWIASRYADIIRHAEPHGRAVFVPTWAVDAYISELDVTWAAPADRRPLWLATLPPIQPADPEPADDPSTPLADAVADRLQLAEAVAA